MFLGLPGNNNNNNYDNLYGAVTRPYCYKGALQAGVMYLARLSGILTLRPLEI